MHQCVRSLVVGQIILVILFLGSTIVAINKKVPIRVGWESKPRTYDPRYAVDANSQYLENLLHCSLLAFDSKGRLVNELAKTWRWKTPTTLELELDESFRYADGKAVSLEDVKATYDFFSQSQTMHPSPRALAFKHVKSIRIEGKRILFDLERPDASFLTNLVLGILPKNIRADQVIDERSVIKGCGPFVHERSTLNEIFLQKNTFYSGAKSRQTTGVNIKIVKDENTRFYKLQKQELDLVQNGINYEKLSNLSAYKTLSMQTAPSLKTTYLGFNFNDPVLKDHRVRKAIALAIDKDMIIKYIFKGLAIPATTMLPPSNIFYNNALKDYKQNLVRANKLLDDAGYRLKPDLNSRFVLTIKTTNNPTRRAIAMALVGQLKHVGITLKVKTLEWGRFKYDVDNGLVQLWTLSWVGFKDPDIYRYAFSTDSFSPKGGNRGRFSHAELDKLLDKGIVTTDQKKRKQIYDQVQLLIHEQLPYIFLFHEKNYVVMHQDIKQFQLYADGRYASLLNVYK